MIEKYRWSELKRGVIKPENDEERNALNEYRKDQALEKTFWSQQIAERKSLAEQEGRLYDRTTLRGFNKSER